MRIIQQGKELMTGIAEGLGEDGALLVRTDQGIEHIIAGDVSLRAMDGGYAF